MSDREDRMEEALLDILQWCDTYPLDIFPECDVKACADALEAVGLSSDRLHASWARHILAGVRRYAESGLAKDA